MENLLYQSKIKTIKEGSIIAGKRIYLVTLENKESYLLDADVLKTLAKSSGASKKTDKTELDIVMSLLNHTLIFNVK